MAQFYTDDEMSLYSGSHLQYQVFMHAISCLLMVWYRLCLTLQGSYESELENLHDFFEKKVVALLCDQVCTFVVTGLAEAV